MKATKRIFSALICICLLLSFATMATAAGTCSITVENQSGTNASVAGKTLNLFKIFNATTDGTNISYQWIEKGGVNLYESFFLGETVKVEGKDVVFPPLVPAGSTIHDVVAYINRLKDDSFNFSQMAASLYTYIHAKGISADKTSDTIPAGATSYTFDDLELGYYLIYDDTKLATDTPAVRSAAMLSHSGENKVIRLKADRPHIEKLVDDSDTDTPEWKLGTTSTIGETVTFRIVTMVPDHDLYGEDYTFEITDKMDDELLLDVDSMKVTITAPATVDEGVTPAAATYKVVTNQAELKDATIDFKVEFSNITDLSKDTLIEITYDAVVTKNADFQNINKAILTYSNDPNSKGSTGSADATASVFLWQFTLTKYMESATGLISAVRLPGAEFQIFSKDDLNNPLTFSETTVTGPNGDYTKYTLDPAGPTTTLPVFGVTDTDDGTDTSIDYTDGGYTGQILLFGLGEGSYVIRETKAPDGYQIAKGDFEFTVSDQVGPTGVIADASITTETRNVKPGQFTRVKIEEGAHKYYVGITNAPGETLPETGGMGTTLFTVLGIVLMAGALAFFTLRKRNSMA